jgi:hypothetical protein
MKQRLTTAECYTSACGKEIELVNTHLANKFLYRALYARCIFRETMRIETILTAQRTSVECHECGNALTINRQTMTGNANHSAYEF